MERREAPKVVATPRERMLPPARAPGAARATERSACANRLLRARGASRRSTAVLRQGGRPPRTEPHSLRIREHPRPKASVDERDSLECS
jgi:hypothetical protein